MWEDKTTGESETKHWVAANTKPCPNCQSNVEKTSGCNLVTCRCGQVRITLPTPCTMPPGHGLSGCAGDLQHFCWLCGGATGLAHTYSTITGHTCGRYKEEADARIEGAQRCGGLGRAPRSRRAICLPALWHWRQSIIWRAQNPGAVCGVCAGRGGSQWQSTAGCRNLKRFQHYEARWAAHVASQKLERKETSDIQVASWPRPFAHNPSMADIALSTHLP